MNYSKIDLYISDLHIGSFSFKKEKELIKLLKRNYNNVYIVGDILDIWEDDLNIILDKYSSLINIINEKSPIIIKGNHDPNICILKEVFPKSKVYEYYVIDDYNIYLHGNKYDSMVNEYLWLSKVLFTFNKYSTRLIGIEWRGVTVKFIHFLKRIVMLKKYNEITLPMEKRVVNDLNKLGKNIIMGHSHLPKKVKINEHNYYVNIGDMISNNTYVEYDRKLNTIDIKRL